MFLDFAWTDENTTLLLEEYHKRKDLFRDPSKKKKDLWWEIRLVFVDQGFDISTDTLDKKFRNMKHTYKRVKENYEMRPIAGRGLLKWKYYNIMKSIFEGINLSSRAEEPPSKIIHLGSSSAISELQFTDEEEEEEGEEVGEEDQIEAEPVRLRKKARRNFFGQIGSVQREQVAAIQSLQSSVDENTAVLRHLVKVQEDRNDILKKLVVTMLSD